MNEIDDFGTLDFACLLTEGDQGHDLSLGSIDTGQPPSQPQVSGHGPGHGRAEPKPQRPHDDKQYGYGVHDDDLRNETGELFTLFQREISRFFTRAILPKSIYG